MTTILHLDSSARSEGSVSRLLSAQAVEQLTKDFPGAKIHHRDLVAQPLPHIDASFLFGMAASNPSPAEKQAVERSDALVAELETADILVIGTPMYNFGVPSQLKAWIDHVCRAGKTFRYTANGPEGLLKNKRALILISTGGVYSAGAMAAFDHVSSYLRQVLGFLGITSVQIVMAEKQGLGADAAADGVASAKQALTKELAVFSKVA